MRAARVGSLAPAEGVRLSDASWFLDRLDPARRAALFTRATRDALSSQPFLDNTWARPVAAVSVPAAELAQADAWPRPQAIIWHTAFCCSTLVASCLDAPGLCLTLKEPMVLPELAQARRRKLPFATDQLFDAVFGLLGRRFAPDEQIVVKSSNAANTLAKGAGAAAERHLMLFSSCQEFVMSVVGGGPASGGGELRRAFVRTLLMERLLTGELNAPWTATDLSVATDLQVAALLWHVQARELRAAAQALGPDRARSLDCAEFLADPAGTLARLDRFFQLGLGAERTRRIASGSKLAAYAKEPSQAFDALRRAAQFRQVAQALGPALPRVVEWSYRLCPDTPQGNPIGSPLAG